jgi:ATP-binding cassette subfamily B protein
MDRNRAQKDLSAAAGDNPPRPATFPQGEGAEEQQTTKVSSWSLIARLLSLGLRHKTQVAAALLVTIIVQVMAVGGLMSAGIAVDVLRHHADPATPAPQWPLGLTPAADSSFMTLMWWSAGAALLFGVVGAVGYYFGRVTNELLAQSIVVDLRDQVYRKLQRLSFTFFDTHDSGTIINRVTGDVQSVRGFLQGILIRAMTSIIALIVFIVAMSAIHLWLTLACLSFAGIQLWLMIRFAKKARPVYMKQRELIDDLTMTLSEAVQGIRVVRSFGRENQQIEKFERESVHARDQRMSIWTMMGNTMPLVQGASWIVVAVLIGYGGILVHRGPEAGGIALGAIWVFFGLLRNLSGLVEQIVSIAAELPESLTGAERVFEILDRKPAIASPATPKRLIGGRARGAIEFRNVTFAYSVPPPLQGGGEGVGVAVGEPSRTPPPQPSPSERGRELGVPVLRNINFTINPGDNIAIVGPTGGGKTTLLKLIPRFYDPQEGQVLIDGVDVRELDLDELRRSIGFVFQEAYLFSNTIESNIAFGDPDASAERVTLAANHASATEFIEHLPENFRTVVGERGLTLSGGERQRLTIARALLIDPPILLLDDAMSAVDPATETAIQREIDRFGASRTTLFIAHRLSSLRRADRVMVIEDGRIVADGTHDELMASDGHYREAALVQLENDLGEKAEGADDAELAPAERGRA